MLKRIIDSCKYVTNNMKYVNINYDVIDSYIKDIKYKDIKHWLSSNPYSLLDMNVEDIINFLLIYESINYSFWGEPKWMINTSDGDKDGSDALMYVMLMYVRNNGYDFSKVSYEDFCNILKGNVEIPLIKERYNTLVNISNVVNDKMNGNFYKYIYDIKTSNELFNIIINNFESFKDERDYDNKKIYYYKLAQLLTSDILHIRELKENIKVDYSNLVGCADYKIPQTMRALNMISYSDELSNIIDNKKEIEFNSIYEIEIRSSMLVVIDYITQRIGNVNSIDVNDYFFILGKKVKDKVKPYHLCRNTNY